MVNKMTNTVDRGYITEVVILTLESFFSVAKGIKDILMVFGTTVRRLNDSLWDPKLIFPSMGSLLMMVVPRMHMVDLDVGEMLYNF